MKVSSLLHMISPVLFVCAHMYIPMYVLASRHVCAMTFYLLSHLIDPASVFHYHKLNLSISLLGCVVGFQQLAK